MLHLVPHLVTQRNARLWVCARGVDATQLDTIALRVKLASMCRCRNSTGAVSRRRAMPLHYQFVDKPTLMPGRAYQATVDINGGERAQAAVHNPARRTRR